MSTVRFDGMDLPMAVNIGERSIEIPIIREWWRDYGGAHVVEVGAVTPYWWDHNAGEIGNTHREQADGPTLGAVEHTVIDPHDPYLRAVRTRAIEYPFVDSVVLSCSTLEHIGTDFPAPGGALEAVETLKKIMREARHFMITWPTGHNRILDGYASTLPDDVLFMYAQVGHHVYEAMREPDLSLDYGQPYPWGNGIVFVTDWWARP